MHDTKKSGREKTAIHIGFVIFYTAAMNGGTSIFLCQLNIVCQFLS